MAIEAPISKFKKNNVLIFIVVCLGLTVWCIYDAHYNEAFMTEHTDVEGNPEGWLVVNLKAPPYLIGAAVLAAGYWFLLRDKKIVADENGLVLSAKEKIPYDSMQKIDKTYYESKGYFILTYKTDNAGQIDRKISNKQYDNLKPILDHLVEKIS